MGLIFGEVPYWADGSGDGSGYGSGYGYGYGYGYGDGYGSGYGDGYGDGSGSGDGDGYGYGSGSGSGDGWKSLAWAMIFGWTESLRENLRKVASQGAFLAFWKSDSHGMPANGGGGGAPVFPGMIQEIDGPLELCTPHALHATLNPDKWKGDRLWIVGLYGEVLVESDKVGALKREILGEIVLK